MRRLETGKLVGLRKAARTEQPPVAVCCIQTVHKHRAMASQAVGRVYAAILLL